MVKPDANDPLIALRGAVLAAAAHLTDDAGGKIGPRLVLEPSPKPEFGDYSTNAAMLLAPSAGKPPREVAGLMAPLLAGADGVERVEIAGPGFLNIFLADRWHRSAVAGMLAAGEALGRPRNDRPERINLEFVSANPTGPLTAAGGRHAAYGDSLARILERCGNEVEREYFINDAGGQIRRFAASIAARMAGQEPPEGGYTGDYVRELAETLKAGTNGAGPADEDVLGQRGVAVMVDSIRTTLRRFGVEFDTWFSERELHESGKVEAAVAALREQGHVYEEDGAVWLRTTDFGDDKDRVLVRSEGDPTYFAADVAYHRDKLERGAGRMIDVLGADHHGYIERMKAAVGALGGDLDKFEIAIMQLVNIVEGGERSQMSKRRGEFVGLDELIDDIGVDAARYFMVQRGNDTAIDLDLDLARSASQENPVYYVQYAHARIAAILRKAVAEGGAKAAGEGIDEPLLTASSADEVQLATAVENSEKGLIKRLLEFDDEIAVAAGRRAPHRLCTYANSLAADFHAFYRDCQVVGVDPALEQARLALCLATKRTLAVTFGLLGVGAPERM